MTATEVDLSDKDYKLKQQVASLAFLEFNGIGRLSSYEEVTYTGSGLLTSLVVDGFIKIQPSLASTNDPRLRALWTIEADGSTAGSQISRFIGLWDITDATSQRAQIQCTIPDVNIRFSTSIHIKCYLLETEAAAFQDLHLFAIANGQIPI